MTTEIICTQIPEADVVYVLDEKQIIEICKLINNSDKSNKTIAWLRQCLMINATAVVVNELTKH